MTIPQFSADESAERIADALGEVGCVVVTGVTDAILRDAIRSDLAFHMEKARM